MVLNKIRFLDKMIFNGYFFGVYVKLYNILIKRKNNRTRFSKLNLRHYKSFIYWDFIFKEIKKKQLVGDIVEGGVGDGETLSYILFQLNKRDKFFGNKSYYGFDSFEGFPEPSPLDNGILDLYKGRWGHVTEKYVRENLQSLGFKNIDLDKTKFIKGFFENTLKNDHSYIKNISILHLDCDLYESYKVCLNFFYPKVVDGGIIMFDEYKKPETLKKFPGAKKAIDEFFGSDVSKIKKHDLADKYFLIK